MDASAASILQSILRRLSRSLLQYVRDAFPYATADDQERLRVLRKLIAEEEQSAARLSAFLRRRRIALPLGVYPQNFTNINYTSLDHLLPHLLAHEKAGSDELERDAAKLWDDLQAREHVQSILDMARRHAQALEQLAVKSPATTPA